MDELRPLNEEMEKMRARLEILPKSKTPHADIVLLRQRYLKEESWKDPEKAPGKIHAEFSRFFNKGYEWKETHKRLLKLAPEILKRINGGENDHSAATGLKLATVPQEFQHKILARAEETAGIAGTYLWVHIENAIREHRGQLPRGYHPPKTITPEENNAPTVVLVAMSPATAVKRNAEEERIRRTEEQAMKDALVRVSKPVPRQSSDYIPPPAKRDISTWAGESRIIRKGGY